MRRSPLSSDPSNKDPIHAKTFIDGLPAITSALIQSVSVAPELLADYQRDWAKVSGYIKLLVVMLPSGFYSTPYLKEAWTAWITLAAALKLEELDGSPVCTNPRCVISFVKDCELGVTRQLCERCHKVSYCSVSCQNV